VRRPSRAGQFALHAALAAGALLILAPYLIMIKTALTPERYVFTGGFHFTLGNFQQAWDQVPWVHYYWNGIRVTGLVFAGQVVTGIPAGYALARGSFRGRGLMFGAVILCLTIPPQVVAVPDYFLLAKAHDLDRISSLVIPWLSSALAVFLFRQFILTIPQSTFDAARLDGVGPLRMLWTVVMPAVRPAIAALGILSVITHWNDLFWPSVVLTTTNAATVPYGILFFANEEGVPNYSVELAASVIAVLPLIAAFCFAQRWLVSGISLTSGTNE
jgi:multiple sugar transport system permease protein